MCLQDSADTITPCQHHFCASCISTCLNNILGNCPICRAFIALPSVKKYNGVPIDQNGFIHHVSSPHFFPSVWVQSLKVGLASYHFEDRSNCYIQYGSASEIFPDLDNGERPPLRKDFTNISVDLNKNVFHGTIDWSPTSFGGTQVWIYTVYFSPDMMTIMRGNIRILSTDKKLKKTHVRLLFMNKYLR